MKKTPYEEVKHQLTSKRGITSKGGMLVVVLALQITAVLLFPGSFVAEGQSVRVFVITLLSSMVLTPISFLGYASRRHIVHESAFILRFMLVMAVGVPLGWNRWPGFLLVLSLIIESAATHGTITSILVNLGVITIDIILMGEHRIWGRMIPAVPWDIRGAIIIGYMAVIYIAVTLSWTSRLVIRKQYEKERLSDTVDRLADAGEGFLSYARSAKRKSAEDERNRLTREIHDIAGYTLTNIRMMMEAGLRNREMDRKERDRLFSWTLEQSLTGLQEIRSILRLIRSDAEGVLRGIKALMQAGSVFQEATGTKVIFEWGNVTDRWIEDDLDLLALRIIQEGLINAFRHGMASQVDIALFQDNNCVKLSIHDNGCGGDIEEMGIGLSGMKERLLAVGGDFKISTNLPGFQITVLLPFTKLDDVQ